MKIRKSIDNLERRADIATCSFIVAAFIYLNAEVLLSSSPASLKVSATVICMFMAIMASRKIIRLIGGAPPGKWLSDRTQAFLCRLHIIRIISAYEFTRSYGGPEEGGWWYTNYRLLEGYIILLPWLGHRMDYLAMTTKMQFDWIAQGADAVVTFQERWIGEYEDVERHYYQ